MFKGAALSFQNKIGLHSNGEAKGRQAGSSGGWSCTVSIKGYYYYKYLRNETLFGPMSRDIFMNNKNFSLSNQKYTAAHGQQKRENNILPTKATTQGTKGGQ